MHRDDVSLDHLRKRQTLREEISYESDTKSHPDRPALKDTLAATTYCSNPERRLYGKEVGQKIQDALKTLSEKERLVFELRHYQGLRLKMIGEIMGSTEETAKNYLFRATQKLRTPRQSMMSCREYQHQIVYSSMRNCRSANELRSTPI